MQSDGSFEQGRGHSRRVELIHCLLQCLGIKSKLLCKSFDRIALFGVLIRGIVDPARTEPVHDRLVCYKVGFLILVSPGFESDHLKCGEEMALALIVETLAMFVDHDSVAMAPDYRVWFGGSGVHQFTMHAAHRACHSSTDIQSHLETKTSVVLEARSDKLQVLGSGTDVSSQPKSIVSIENIAREGEPQTFLDCPQTHHRPA